MFPNVISETPLTQRGANEYFSNIAGTDWYGDVTMVTTLRALLAERMKEGERIDFVIDTQSVRRVPAQLVAPMEYIFTEYENTLLIRTISDHDEWFEWMERNPESRPGWHRVEKVTLFFRKVFKIQCFINPELKSAVLFVPPINVQRLHYLQCGIPTFVPWFFEEKPITEQELALIRSLTERTPEKYEEIISSIAEKYDFDKLWVQRMLKDFETRYERDQLSRAENNIIEIVNRIRRLNEQIAEQLGQKRTAEIQLLGLKERITQQNGESEIMDFFLNNKSLVLKNVYGTRLEFCVKTNLINFDSDMAEDYISNKRSIFYEYCNTEEERDDRRLLLNALFIDQTLQLQMCAAYRFDICGNVTAMSNYDFGPEFKKYMPNPHIDEYSCMGDYIRHVNETLMNGNYIIALAQCIASCGSLNFGDSPVMHKFMPWFFGQTNRNNRCVLLPDGRVVRPDEAIAWLKEQEG